MSEVGEGGVWMHYAATHTWTRCEVEDWRTWRWRFCHWLAARIENLAGQGRSEPRVRIVPPPSGGGGGT